MNKSVFRRIGLTGGIGSGKSTLARFFLEAGMQVIDADQISRQLTTSGGAAIPAILQSFGAEFIADDGSMNRERMRELVFTDSKARMQLQALLHPMITAGIQDLQNKILINSQFVFIEIPLLIESTYWRYQIDRVLVVDCEENTQIRRVVQRSQLKPEQVSLILAQQASRQQRLAAADWVVNNETDNLAQLKDQAIQIQLHF